MNHRKIMSDLAEIKEMLLSQIDSGKVIEENDKLKKENSELAKTLGRKESEIKKLKVKLNKEDK